MEYDNLYNSNNAPLQYYEDLAFYSFAYEYVPIDYADEAIEYFRSNGLECNY